MNKMIRLLCSHWQFTPGRSRRGMALVITLAASVLLTMLLVAFFSLALLNRQISFSSTNLVKTDLLTRTAMDKVIGEVREEIRNPSNSTATTTSGVTIYTPKASTNSIPVHDSALAAEKNLVRISSATPPATSSALASSSVLSSTPSANNRFLSGSRWNRIALRTDPISDPISAATTPSWILVTRSGPKTSVTLADAGDKNSGDYVIGRYAYAIYDEGGLLDINVAGYPTSASGAGERKGPASFADLAAVGIPGMDKWPNWRQRLVTTLADYVNAVLNVAAPKGFTNVPAANNTFLSRRDAISFAKANTLSAALPYLGTSLFEKNGPVIPAGSNPALNPDFTKLISPLTGKPLQRFPLSRFKLLDKDPATLSSAQEADILKYFGLVARADASNTYRAWQYRSPTIGSPAAAISGGRDPDLFELLYAAIVNDSLGAFCTNNSPQQISQLASGAYTPETNPHHQVARIIANMIDQSDADNYPTTIIMGGDPVANTVHGIEHLPYFSELFVKIYYPSNDLTSNAGAQGHIYFELWDPHQGSAPSGGPTEVRVMPTASSRVRLHYFRLYGPAPYTHVIKIGSDPYAGNTPSTPMLSADPSNANGVNIGALGKYSNPLVAYTEDASDPTRRSGMTIVNPPDPTVVPAVFNSLSFSSQLIAEPSTPQVGELFYDSDGIAPNLLTPGNDGYSNDNVNFPTYGGNFISFVCSTTTFLLQYKDAGGNWRTYTTFAGHEDDNGITGFQQGMFTRDEISTNTLSYTRNYNSRIDQPNGSIPKPDPRTFRFRTGASTGVVNTVTGVITGLTPNAAMVSGADPGQMLDGSGPSTYPNNNNGMLYKNSGAAFKLADIDGIARVADGYLGSAANPMAAGATTARPIILNRPFRSVAELGYVFRDVPWKSLNLFSSDSGDAALMELFSIEEGDVVAGKTSLNTPHKEVVKALVQGALRDESDSATGVNPTDATTVATDLVAATTATSLLNRAELVTKFIKYNGATSGGAYPAIKTQREATVRALASATQTRTWNLLIDLVAQSGRYPANPTGLEKFIVEGEKHCWMHVAIDRYTGEILRTQLEVVDE